MKDIYILGTSLSHDGSSCLMKNGKILVAIEKERITRKKHDGFNDDLTIDYCLDAAGITLADVDLIVEESTMAAPELKPFEKEKVGVRKLDSIVDLRRVKISHHLAHAYAAIGLSSYEKAAVIVMDGQGSSLYDCIDAPAKVLPDDIKQLPQDQKYLYWEKESLYYFDGCGMSPVFKDFSKFLIWDKNKFPVSPMDIEHSIAQFYGGVSYYVFDDLFCEGKLMGLAPYGREDVYHDLEAFEFKDGRVFLKKDWMNRFPLECSGKYKGLFGSFQYFADIAKWAQRQLEKAIQYVFQSYAAMCSCDNVAYAGGLAMNAVANGVLQKSGIFKNYFFLPPANDSNLSIGCCYYGWIEILKHKKVMHDGSIYFGRKYKLDITSLEENLLKTKFDWNNDHIIKVLAQKIAEGKVIALFLDGAEFGPRALGHRSILADPRSSTVSNYINRKIKNREDFRPFAPSVLTEKVNEIFDCDDDRYPYMITVANVRKDWIDKIPGVTHVDGSARIQTVHEEICPRYHKLINAFYQCTGIPVLLNTSFNGHGMPIIETPGEALKFFNAVRLDILVLDNHVFAKNREDIDAFK